MHRYGPLMKIIYPGPSNFNFDIVEYDDKYKNDDCYCVCHSPFSSCASCDHCKGVYLKRMRGIKSSIASSYMEFPNIVLNKDLLKDAELYARQEIDEKELKRRTIERITNSSKKLKK